MVQKHFTLEEANRALKLIGPIVGDILGKIALASQIHNEVKKYKILPNESETDMLAKLNRAEKLLNEVEYHMKELDNVGVLIRDLKYGVVDFPSVYQNRLIYLCWSFGDPGIKFWHETSESLHERKPVEFLAGKVQIA